MRFHLLPDMSALTGAEYLPGSQTASDKKFSLNTLRTWIFNAAAALAANSTAVTQAAGDSSTKIATTAFVGAAVAAAAFPVQADATNARNMAPADASKYTRFTAVGAKTATFDSATAGFAANQSFLIANRAASDDLTLVAAGTMVLNAPNGGSLVLVPGQTVLVKMVSATEADLVP
jgi:hypothetical protein